MLTAIGFSLIAPAVLLDTESILPACCRRNGAHHCVMSDGAQPASGISLVAVPTPCSSYPGDITLPTYPKVWLPGPASAIFAAMVSHPSIFFQTESHYRVSFSRCRQKRGPPDPLA